MRRFLLALGILLSLCAGADSQAPIVGPGQAIICTAIATLAVGPSAATQIVAAVTGQSIKICGWHITNTGATGTFALESGTGTNCASSTVTTVPAQNVTSTAPATDHIDFASIQLPISTALCIVPSVATIAAVVYYTQY